MKRDDAFSKGLAGFIERTVSGSNHAKVTKREKINELKSLIQKALKDVDNKKYESTKKNSEEGDEKIIFCPYLLECFCV